MFQYVQPAKVLAALQRLKLNNPLYKDIEINDDWTSNAKQDLWEAVSAERCPPSSPPPTTNQVVSAEQCPPPTTRTEINGK